MTEKTIDQLIIDELKMPKKIYIGDLEFLNDDNIISNVFSRNFKCKSKWVGEANLRKVEIKTNENTEFADYLTIIYAPTQKLLSTYKNKTVFEHQKITNTEVLTISKQTAIKINDNFLSINLNNKGLFADILEVSSKSSKLEGLIINLYLGDNEFNSLKSKIKNLL